MKKIAFLALLFAAASAYAEKIDVTKQAREAVARGEILAVAQSLLGVDYWPGGQDTDYGYDCSGLTQHAYNSVGIKIPRTSVEQYRRAKAIPITQLKRGDLVFFNTRGLGPTHVGIYAGRGRFIHAPGIGKTIRYDSMKSRYWSARFFGAGTYF